MILWILLVAVGLFSLTAFYLYLNQGRILFHPSRELGATPADIGIPFKDVRITVEHGQAIHAWFVIADAGRPTVLFCHGNAGNISHRLETVGLFRDLRVNVLMFDYRGYGLSDGSPSEENMYADARAAYAWLVREQGVLPERLFVFGRSLGAAVAIELATEIPCAGLIIESSFTSIVDMGKRLYPFMPVNWLVRYRFDSLERIREITTPILVIHSPDDDLIRYEMGRQLFAAAGSGRSFLEISGGHNDRGYLRNQLYRTRLLAFFDGTSGT